MFKIKMTKLLKTEIERNQSGYTLVEAVISIALIGVVAVALFTGLGTASKVLLVTDARETAKNLAETQMEYIKSAQVDFNPLANTYVTPASLIPASQSAYVPSNVVYHGSDALYFNPVRDDNIQKIIVTITGAGLTTPYTLEGYKVKW